MAGKPKRMSQVKQILRMHLQGKGKKTIARALSVSKNTVKEYMAKATQNPIASEELLELEDPVFEAKLLPGNHAYKHARYDYLKEHFDYYSKELNKVRVNRVLLWEEYSHNNPHPYSYAQFCHHLLQYRRSSKP